MDEIDRWWLSGTKIGYHKIFSSPEILFQACMEYFDFTAKRNWKETDWVGKDATEVERKKQIPFTKEGLYVFLGINKQTWLNYSTKPEYSNYFDVTSRVNSIIYTQKIEGAMCGAYNASIVAHELGLKAKSEVEVVDNRKDVSKLFPDENELTVDLDNG